LITQLCHASLHLLTDAEAGREEEEEKKDADGEEETGRGADIDKTGSRQE